MIKIFNQYNMFFTRQNMRQKLSLILIFTLFLFTKTSFAINERNTSINYHDLNSNTKEITVQINLGEKDFAYQDYINVSCDNPKIKIISWSVIGTPKKYFSKEFKDTKNIFDNDFIIKIKAGKKIEDINEIIKDAHLHVSYYLNSRNSIVEDIVPFNKAENNIKKYTKNMSAEEIDFDGLESELSNHTNEYFASGKSECTSANTEIEAGAKAHCHRDNQENISCACCQDKSNFCKDYSQDAHKENSQDSDQNNCNDNSHNNAINNCKENSQNNSLDNANSQITITKNTNEEKDKQESWTNYLENILKKTDSIWIRLLFALILGIILSLTPCIYPMIPITVGIIQAHGSKSFSSNLFLSLIYTSGIAITFAILGLVAALTGQLFSTMLSNPIFVITLVTILTYLGLSMLGLYEIYIPKFLQTSGNNGSKKSLLSVFMLGIVSGTIASPCVSPGLVLLLSIVTALGSKLLGFALLFAFGFGLGTPLIIAGTFSGAINKLPRAGMWMIEVKRIFGLLIFGVCFYFLKNILPEQALLITMAGFSLFIGIFYLANIKPYDSKAWKIIKNFIGVAFCTISVFIVVEIYKEKFITQNLQSKKKIEFWQEDYDKALAQAKQENKKLFIDFTTDTCSICKAIGKKVFENQTIINEIKDKFVNVKITVSDTAKEPFASLNQKHKIIGFPTFLLINPNTGDAIKRWSSEFYYMTEQELISLFKGL